MGFKKSIADLELNKVSKIDDKGISVELFSNKDSIEFGHNE